MQECCTSNVVQVFIQVLGTIHGGWLMIYKGRCIHCKNWLAILTEEWLPWLQTSWRDRGYEVFTLVLETNCIRRPASQPALIISLTILGNICKVTKAIFQKLPWKLWWHQVTPSPMFVKDIKDCSCSLLKLSEPASSQGITKVTPSNPLSLQLVCNQDNHSSIKKKFSFYSVKSDVVTETTEDC